MNSEHVARILTTEPRDCAEIAQSQGLDRGFVELVDRALQDPAFDTRVIHGDDADDLAPIFWKKWTRRPLWFVFITLVLWKLLHLVTTGVIQFMLPKSLHQGAHSAHTIASLAILLLVCLLHAACYYRHIMIRWVLYGSLIFVGIQIVGGAIEKLILGASLTKIGLASIGYFFTIFPYVLALIPFAVLGGYLRVRKGEKRRTQLSRQQLIERLFDVRNRLSMVQTGNLEDHTIRTRLWFIKAQQNFYRLCAYASFLGYGVTMFLEALSGDNEVIMGVILALMSLGNLVLVAAIGFVAGKVGRAVLGVLVYSFAGLPLMLVPIGKYGPKFFTDFGTLFQIGFGTVFYLFIGIVAAVGSSIEAQAQRDRMLRANAPALLQAELESLESQLRPQARRVCVMDVDAYRSALMKSESDPYEAEWSFREYQNLITRVCSRYLGSIHSTAGDGAVVGFPSSAQALDAAIALQAEIAVFNMKVNRLPLPFIIRIGLHTGDLQGELDQVQFTEVIDVAAHIQKAVPVGTIGVSERTLENLEHEKFTTLGQKVDGYEVFVLNNVIGPQDQVKTLRSENSGRLGQMSPQE